MLSRRQLLTAGAGVIVCAFFNGHALAISRLRWKEFSSGDRKSPAEELIKRVQYPGKRPSEVYYDAKSNLNPVHLGWRDHRLEIPGTRRNAQGAQIIELRGWLRQECDDCIRIHPNRSEHPDPNDFRFELEIDPAWTDEKGINLHDLMRVGTILMHNTSGNPFAAVSRPLIHIEIMAWRPRQSLGKFIDPGDYLRTDIPDPGWTFRDTDKPNPDSWRHENDPRIIPDPNTTWPWNPLYASNDPTRMLKHVPPHEETDGNKGDYVLVEGALITDDVHWTANGSENDDTGEGASRAWGDHILRFGLNPKENKYNPSRWTEIHPPDRVEVLPYKPPRETVRCVAVIARPKLPAEETTLNIQIPPPAPRPDPRATLECLQIVGPETKWDTVITRPIISKAGDTVHVFATVRGEKGSLISPDIYGQFKAVYRVFWKVGPPQLRLSPSPGSVPVAQPVSFTVNANDWHTGNPIRGHVRLDGRVVGETNAPFTLTFHEGNILSVLATGYDETRVTVPVILRKLRIWTRPQNVEGSGEVTVFGEDAESHLPVAGGKVFVQSPRLARREVAPFGVPFNFTESCRFVVTQPCPPPCRRAPCDPDHPRPGCCEPPIEECVPEGHFVCSSIYAKALDYEEVVVYRGSQEF
jgi:hypothetical protein